MLRYSSCEGLNLNVVSASNGRRLEYYSSTRDISYYFNSLQYADMFDLKSSFLSSSIDATAITSSVRIFTSERGQSLRVHACVVYIFLPLVRSLPVFSTLQSSYPYSHITTFNRFILTVTSHVENIVLPQCLVHVYI